MHGEQWTLTIPPPEQAPANLDLDLAHVSDVVLRLHHRAGGRGDETWLGEVISTGSQDLLGADSTDTVAARRLHRDVDRAVAAVALAGGADTDARLDALLARAGADPQVRGALKERLVDLYPGTGGLCLSVRQRPATGVAGPSMPVVHPIQARTA